MTKNKQIITTMVIATLFAFLLIGTASAQEPYAEIQHSPTETPISEEFTIEFDIINPSNKTKNISYQVNTPTQENLEIISGDLTDQLNLIPYQTLQREVTLTYNFEKTEDVSLIPDYEYSITVEAENSTTESSKTQIKPIYPKLEYSEQIQKTELVKGEATNISLEIENTGTYQAEDIETILETSKNIQVTEKTKTIQEIGKDETKEITYQITPQKDGNYQPNISIKYDNTIEEITHQLPIDPITVETPEITAEFNKKQSNARLNNPVRINLTVSNIGNKSTQITANLKTNDSLTIPAASKQLNFPIQPGEEQKVSYLIGTEETGKHTLTSIINYTVNNQEKEIKNTYKINVEEPELEMEINHPTTINTTETKTGYVKLINVGNYSTQATISAQIDNASFKFIETDTSTITTQIEKNQNKTLAYTIETTENTGETTLTISTTYSEGKKEIEDQKTIKIQETNEGILQNLGINKITQIPNKIIQTITSLDTIYYIPFLALLMVGGWILYRHKQFTY